MQCMNNEGGSLLVFSRCFARRAVAALSRQKSRLLCEVRRPPCLRLERKYAQWRLMGKGRTRQSWWTSVAIRHIREAFFSSILLVFFHFPIFLFFSHFAFFCSASSPSGSLDKNSAPSTSLNIEKEREKKRRQRGEKEVHAQSNTMNILAYFQHAVLCIWQHFAYIDVITFSYYELLSSKKMVVRFEGLTCSSNRSFRSFLYAMNARHCSARNEIDILDLVS